MSGIVAAKSGQNGQIEISSNDEITWLTRDKNDNIIQVLRPKKQNQFHIKSENNEDNIHSFIIATLENAITWHRRICHCCSKDIAKYLKRYNIKISSVQPTTCMNCKICKQKRKPHKGTITQAIKLLEVIHSYIYPDLLIHR